MAPRICRETRQCQLQIALSFCLQRHPTVPATPLPLAGHLPRAKHCLSLAALRVRRCQGAQQQRRLHRGGQERPLHNLRKVQHLHPAYAAQGRNTRPLPVCQPHIRMDSSGGKQIQSAPTSVQGQLRQQGKENQGVIVIKQMLQTRIGIQALHSVSSLFFACPPVVWGVWQLCSKEDSRALVCTTPWFQQFVISTSYHTRKCLSVQSNKNQMGGEPTDYCATGCLIQQSLYFF